MKSSAALCVFGGQPYICWTLPGVFERNRDAMFTRDRARCVRMYGAKFEVPQLVGSAEGTGSKAALVLCNRLKRKVDMRQRFTVVGDLAGNGHFPVPCSAATNENNRPKSHRGNANRESQIPIRAHKRSPYSKAMERYARLRHLSYFFTCDGRNV